MRRLRRRGRHWLWALAGAWGALLLAAESAPAAADHAPTRFGYGLAVGNTYDPRGDITFVQLVGGALLDYDRVWPHRAPDALRFRVEVAAGLTVRPRPWGVISANALASYFPQTLSGSRWRAFGEAGIGLIYTGFRAAGQGLRFNFNPQFGVGLELGPTGAPCPYVALRAHHLSNGDLHPENRGVNSLVLHLGTLF